MRLTKHESIHALTAKTRQLVSSMLSPLCGINQEIGYVARSGHDQKLIVGSGALTGVHVLSHRPNPGRGAYHIGGAGFLPNESLIRTLGETLERCAQLTSGFTFEKEIKFAKRNSFVNENVLSENFLSLCSEEQLSQSGFPFERYENHHSLGWIKMHSLYNDEATWLPAQCVLVGYSIKKAYNEPWITAAVTTGTAAHINYPLALKGALLELIQLDSVIGHWYTKSMAYQIKFDDRLTTLSSLINRYQVNSRHQFKFFLLPNPDLAGFSVACLYSQTEGLPKVVIGLGADVSLENAMYKAYLETVASIGLARMVILKGKAGLEKHESVIDAKQIYDLDRNVEYYGLGLNNKRIMNRFLKMPTINASELPADITGNIQEQIQTLVQSFQVSKKQLYLLDLTKQEEKRLGFKVIRVWSPQTLSLCLPSAPPKLHSRFLNYGGIDHDDPHPYP